MIFRKKKNSLAFLYKISYEFIFFTFLQYNSRQNEFKQKFDDYTNDLISLKWPTLMDLRSIVFDTASKDYDYYGTLQSNVKKCINES